MTTVFIRNNPYMRRVEIQVNGNSPSSYSRLNGIMNEPFLFWVNQIISLLHDEINEDEYELIFESRQEELDILEKLSEQDSKCVRFTKKKLSREILLNTRMSIFSKFLKKNNVSVKEVKLFVLFIIPDNKKQLKEDLEKMQIENSYCKVNIKVVFHSEYKKNIEDPNSIFLVYENAEQYEQGIQLDKSFIIILGNNNSFKGLKDSSLVYLSTENDFFNTIFKCLMLGPLEEALHQSIASIPQDVREEYLDDFENILGTAPRVFLDVESSIVENGNSINMKISSESGDTRDLNFTYDYNPRGIINCDGTRINGLRDGNVTLYVYRRGDREPCVRKKFKVITRNRVRELSVEDTEIFIGEGDSFKISWDYVPRDADNLNEIEWVSDNKNVVTVSNNGRIYGIKQGNATIRLCCDRISKTIKVHVFPHIKDIKVDVDEIVLLPQMNVSINIESVPSSCIEGRLLCAIMDARIANFANGCITAFAFGETTLVIQDKTERMRKEIPVRVVTQKEWDKIHGIKRGLIARLFGN